MRELKQTRIKGDLGMKIADFNAAYRLYKLEDDDRDTFLDAIRETFEALGIGQQLDWLKAADDDAGVSDDAIREARVKGREAGAIGKARSEEHTSELQSLMRILYAVFCLKKKYK